MSDTPNLPRMIRAELERRGISQREAAESVGVTQQTFSRWANGKLIPNRESMPRLARWLRIPVADLKGLRADMSPSTQLDRIETALVDVAGLLDELLRRLDPPRPKRR